MTQTFVTIPVEEWNTMIALMGELKSLLNERKPKVWLTKKETCKALNISSTTFARYRGKGLLRTSQIGKKLYVLHSDVEQLIENSRQR